MAGENSKICYSRQIGDFKIMVEFVAPTYTLNARSDKEEAISVAFNAAIRTFFKAVDIFGNPILESSYDDD